MADRLSSVLGDPSAAPYTIAEIGGNHGGRLDLALAMVDAAAAVGADAAKFQVYRTRALCTADMPGREDFEREELPPDAVRSLAARCASRRITFLATPFDEESLALVAELGAPAIKIASGDVTHWPLLRAAARCGRPLLLSTGAATFEELAGALAAIREVRAVPVVLMHCTAAYPAPDAEANLAAIPALREQFGLPVGFSDHTLGVDVALGAVAVGACVVEKHFTTDVNLPGGDNAMSITPLELERLVRGSRRVAAARGAEGARPTASERVLLPAMRRSLVAARPLAAGSTLTADSLAAKRPARGIAPCDLEKVLGRRTTRALAADEALRWEDLG
jgi:N-acetylneuraminate synthase/N,N'-diacetyllegionaminate synthase